MSELLELTKQLINIQSVSPNDAGCQSIIADFLTELGFHCQLLPSNKVSNLWAHYGNSAPLVVLAGHTDVVPAGKGWQTAPFNATIKNNKLYGRGAADMKGSLAAMLIATKKFLANHQPNGSIGFLLTSGEEGDHYLDGTPIVMQHLTKKNIDVDYCILGEPSCQEILGDTIRHGRRGSITCKVTIKGKQGHVAYHHLADNPIHRANALLNELITLQWDQGNEYFPATSLQVTHFNSDSQAGNVIPGCCYLQFNIRYNNEWTTDNIQTKILKLLKIYLLDYEVSWLFNGEPFVTKADDFLKKMLATVKAVTGIEATLSTGGGTSDGRFIVPYGVKLIEFGPVNKTIHQVDECIAVDELIMLEKVYRAMLHNLL